MINFDDALVTKDYLVEQLIVARQKNEVLTDINRRLERLLIKCIKDLQDATHLINDLTNATDELVAKVIKQ